MRIGEVPPERIIGKIVGKNEERLFLVGEVIEVDLVLIDSVEIDVGDEIFVYFDEITRFDFVTESKDSQQVESKRKNIFSTYYVGQEVLYYFRSNTPKGKSIILKNDNDLRIIN